VGLVRNRSVLSGSWVGFRRLCAGSRGNLERDERIPEGRSLRQAEEKWAEVLLAERSLFFQQINERCNELQQRLEHLHSLGYLVSPSPRARSRGTHLPFR
jgi:hypothetical protein